MRNRAEKEIRSEIAEEDLEHLEFENVGSSSEPWIVHYPSEEAEYGISTWEDGWIVVHAEEGLPAYPTNPSEDGTINLATAYDQMQYMNENAR